MIKVKAKDVYRAKAKRGFRYVRVERVHKKDHVPYVDLVEVYEDGSDRKGRMRDGFLASLVFNTFLTCKDGAWVMPLAYEPAGEVR